MLTYQDLLEIQDSDEARMDFDAIPSNVLNR